MKIAVTYDNGSVFQHFGKSEQFKIYEAEDGRIVSAQVVDTEGAGHSALAGKLQELGADVLICGGIGDGAKAALADLDIVICAGVSGDADEAAQAYLDGELESTEGSCDHHDGGEGCGHHCGSADGEDEPCEGDCGGGCSGCGGHMEPVMEGKNVGKQVRAHYRGTFNDGTQFDSSYDRGDPLAFVCGVGQMIRGFDAAVANMEVGEAVDVHLMPEEAYGPADPNAVFEVEIASLPGSEGLSVGQQVYLTNQYGQQFPVKVTAKDETNITFDANHEMAGKELNFHIELVEVLD